MTGEKVGGMIDLRPAILFTGTSLVVAIVVAAMLVSGWRAGSLSNDVEWVFWAGTILGAIGVACFGAAVAFRGDRLIRAGLLLFASAPVLCVVAVIANYWV